ncbi:restriction endonuclease subunit S [Xanthomonas hortorum pv. pelargonii]|uniref:restriction endonuclease subunit S n=1 Tax=Xanthomonas hortorum TaxID=56454 RepID=UPI0021C60789|nr:restriction endonuclease subunit S [Xanthomonas hortorum]MCU1714256.1 restriction endonuclease subunit S [Xanthomonas hortorum pv. pelargonii]
MELKLGDVVNYADNTTVQPDAMQEDAWLLELEDIERDSSHILAYETVGKRKPQSAKNSFHAGDMLYGKLRPYLNKVVRADRNGYSSSEIIAIKPNQLDGGYLFHYLKSPRFRDYVQAVTHGVRMPRLGTEQAKTAPFLLPPLAEQKRIAQKLDTLLAQVDTLKARIDAIPALLKRFIQSVLTSAATCELTSEWRATQGLDDPVPTKLGELIRTGPQNGLYKPSSAYGSGTKIVRIDGFYSGELRDWHSFRSLQLDAREEQVWALKVGDILINRVNSIEYLGKCALVRSLPGPTVFESNMMRIAVDERVIEPEFLMRALSAEIGRARLIANAKHAVNQASINQRDVKACSILVPTLSEQTEIVRRVEQLFAYADQLETKVATAQQRINTMTQSLLAKAFRGELVPQDPSDEPASVLLERIRNQRAATPKPKRGRKAAAH